MESEEITKLVDGVYKNILEKFNPGARQLITAGKGYLKALHGAASASRLFNEALAKIAMNAQQSGTGDIGAALLNVVSVYKEIQEQQMNILKAFYVDLLVPLETNLEKDTKVVQHEQKKFMQQHKVRVESYHKAVTTMKKQRKKKSSPENTEKELRSLQILEDQKKKLDAFCEQSYKNAMTQERRRYGFVLERQCSIAKHWMAYHATGRIVIDNNLENWQEIAASREVIPASAYEASFNNSNINNNGGQKRMERIKNSDDGHVDVGGGGGASSSSQLKKARSVDAPYGDMRTLHESNTNYSQNSLPRAKSDFNLTTTSSSIEHIDHNDHHGHWDQRPVVRALYAYMPSGENQLPFDEGDRIALVGSKAKGWQFGENLRTQMFGWFPIAYTNAEGAGNNNNNEKSSLSQSSNNINHQSNNNMSKPERVERNSERYENMHYERNGGGGGGGMRSYQEQFLSSEAASHIDPALESDSTYRRRNNSAEESSPTRMFGDTINFRNQKKYRASSGANPRPGPPPTLPAPVPSGQSSSRHLNTSQSFCAPNGAPAAIERRKNKAQQQQQPNGAQATHSSMGHMSNVVGGGGGGNQVKPAAAAKTSLHSSNDSGFANEPPPQPEVDYSDEEQSNRVPIRRRADTNSHQHTREVASWTLNRNFRSSVDSQIDDKSLNALSKHSSGKMRYDLIASDDEILQASSGGIKRTKSFWKFGGRNDDILAGMSLWQHRDLVAAPNLEEMRDEDYQRKSSNSQSTMEQHQQQQQDTELDKNGTLTKSHSNNSSASSNEKVRKDSITSMELYDDDENIYGMSPMVRRENVVVQQQQTRSNTQQAMHSNYTPKSRMKIMKTIEIDIENPTESERLSTIKRGQKEYAAQQQQQQQQQHREYREVAGERGMLQQTPQMRSARDHHQPDGKKSSGGMQNRNSSVKQKNSNDTKSNHHVTTTQKQSQSRSKTQHELVQSSDDDADSDDNGTLKMSDVNNFFDDLPHDSGMVMKTVKRKDILKQYYTSEDESDDVEIKSTSSDPYDCIVINDHLVRSKEEKQRRQMRNSYQEHQMEFQTFRASGATPQVAMMKTTSSSTTTSKKKSADVRNGTSGGGVAKQHQYQQQQQQQQLQHQQQQEQQDHERYNSSSTLTRNSTANLAMSTPTATILPRTRLMKSSNTMTLERTHHKSQRPTNESSRAAAENGGAASLGGGSDREKHFGKTYGPWYDFWDQQDQHTLVSQKSMNMNSKMK